MPLRNYSLTPGLLKFRRIISYFAHVSPLGVTSKCEFVMFEEVFRGETSGASRPNYATGGVLVGPLTVVAC